MSKGCSRCIYDDDDDGDDLASIIGHVVSEEDFAAGDEVD